MKVCIISGRFPETKFDSAINHKLYADKYGYTYIHCNWPTKEYNPYKNKIKYLLAYVDLFDYLIWIDDDAFFFNFDVDIMDFKPDTNTFISLCKSPNFKQLKTYFSSGQFILKCSEFSKLFLYDVLKQNLLDIKNWWTPSLGYFSNGDQDAMVYLFLTNETYKNKAKLFDYEAFNSRVENVFGENKHEIFILHFTGKKEIKWSNYLKVQKTLKMNSFLVPESIIKNYPMLLKRAKRIKIKISFKKMIKCLLR